MPITRYIDGDRNLQNRAIKFDPTNNNAHMQYVALESEAMSNNRVKVANVPVDFEGNQPSVSGVATISIDCRSYNFLFIRLENTGTTAWTDCIVDISSKFGSNKWETVANGDYFFTTGTGEQEGNPMKQIRKVGVNPRTLPANSSTWILFFIPGIPQLRLRISTNSAVNFLYTLSNE